MDERATSSVWGLVARCRVLQTLNNSRFSTSIVSDNDSDWREKLNDRYLLVVEGTNAPYCKFVETRHLQRGI
jgi:hypothetical protein